MLSCTSFHGIHQYNSNVTVVQLLSMVGPEPSIHRVWPTRFELDTTLRLLLCWASTKQKNIRHVVTQWNQVGQTLCIDGSGWVHVLRYRYLLTRTLTANVAHPTKECITLNFLLTQWFGYAFKWMDFYSPSHSR